MRIYYIVITLIFMTLLSACGGSGSSTTYKDTPENASHAPGTIRFEESEIIIGLETRDFFNPLKGQYPGTYYYTSSDESIASVYDSGVVIPWSPGRTTIETVSINEDGSTAAIGSYLLIVKENPDLKFKSSTVLTTVVNDELYNPLVKYPEDVIISYKSSNENIASVNSEGIVKAISLGEADIIASTSETERYLSTSSSYKISIKDKYYIGENCASNESFISKKLNSNTIEYILDDKYCIGIEHPKILKNRIPVTSVISSSKFDLDENAVVTQIPNSDYIKYFFKITNISNEFSCFVKMNKVKIKANGNFYPIRSDSDLPIDLDLLFVNAEIGYIPSIESLTNTCLHPGAVGYISSIEKMANLYISSVNEIESISINSISHTNSPAHPVSELHPLWFSWTPSEYFRGFGEISFTLENNTDYNVKSNLSLVIFFDTDDDAVDFSFLRDDATQGVKPSETIELKKDISSSVKSNRIILIPNIEIEDNLPESTHKSYSMSIQENDHFKAELLNNQHQKNINLLRKLTIISD